MAWRARATTYAGLKRACGSVQRAYSARKMACAVLPETCAGLTLRCACLQEVAWVLHGLARQLQIVARCHKRLRAVYINLRGVHRRLRAFPGSCAGVLLSCARLQALARAHRNLRGVPEGCAAVEGIRARALTSYFRVTTSCVGGSVFCSQVLRGRRVRPLIRLTGRASSSINLRKEACHERH